MKKVHRKLRKSGFTLVELLIVIIIIGILAGSLLLVAGSSTDKAEATKIVSTMRTLKTGALMFNGDYSPAWPLNFHSINSYIDSDLSGVNDSYAAKTAVYTLGGDAGTDSFGGTTLLSSDKIVNMYISATVANDAIAAKVKTIEGVVVSDDTKGAHIFTMEIKN